ncbi:MAG: GNAT family N-acetyltransferase, partial [Elusimicrobia bacterium]|nr:GNAT family N-acetyltransferase [Elusimicrobiota bacterium]
MRLDIRDGFHLSAIGPADKAAYLEHLADHSVYENTCAIPYPYTEKDAEDWIAKVAEGTHEAGRVLNWAMREPGGRLIGGIGLAPAGCRNPYAAELGYWLAR